MVLASDESLGHRGGGASIGEQARRDLGDVPGVRPQAVRSPALAGRPLQVADEPFDSGDHAEPETGPRRAVGRLQ